MIKLGDKVTIKFGLFKGKSGEVQIIAEHAKGKSYKIEGCDIFWEEGALEKLPEKENGLYVTVGCDTKLIKGIRDTISEAVCELKEYATNEHSYYTADGKEMLSTWKQKGDHVYDVHTFEKVSPSNWKQLS